MNSRLIFILCPGTLLQLVVIFFKTMTIMEQTPKVPFYVNRPFLYAITEKDTGAILFIGTVKNPQLN